MPKARVASQYFSIAFLTQIPGVSKGPAVCGVGLGQHSVFPTGAASGGKSLGFVF